MLDEFSLLLIQTIILDIYQVWVPWHRIQALAKDTAIREPDFLAGIVFDRLENWEKRGGVNVCLSQC